MLAADTHRVHIPEVHLTRIERRRHIVVVLGVLAELLRVVGAPVEDLAALGDGVRDVGVGRYVHDVLELVDLGRPLDLALHLADAQAAVAVRAHGVHAAHAVQEERVMHAADDLLELALEAQHLEYVGLIAVLGVLDAQLVAVVEAEADDQIGVLDLEEGAVGRRPDVLDLLVALQLLALAEAHQARLEYDVAAASTAATRVVLGYATELAVLRVAGGEHLARGRQKDEMVGAR